jgi:hypothetical protein
MSAHHDELRIRRSDDATRTRIQRLINKDDERTTDAALIASCAAAERLADDVFSGRPRPDDEMLEQINELYAYINALAATPATTAEAKRHKGRLAFKVLDGVVDDVDDTEKPELLALSALRDLFGEAVA